MDAATTIAIIQAILTYGPSAIVSIANLINTQGAENLTDDAIKALFIEKDPSEYFK